MPIREKTLRVYPNPWTYIDHLGRPAGVVRLDPFEHNTNRAWVGARIATTVITRKAVTEVIKGKSFQGNANDHDIAWEFSDGPIEIPNTAYYRGEINAGSLIAANGITAQQCGIAVRDFVDPVSLLEQMKADAIREFDAQNGDGAFAHFARQRDESTAESVEESAPERSNQTSSGLTAQSATSSKGD